MCPTLPLSNEILTVIWEQPLGFAQAAMLGEDSNKIVKDIASLEPLTQSTWAGGKVYSKTR